MTTIDPTPSANQPAAAATSWIGAIIALLVVTILTLSTGLTPIRSDNDTWWHVKSGQYIAENGIPKHDVMNFMAEEMEWHNHEWLSQVLMYYAWKVGDGTTLGGWRSLIVFKTFVLLITNIALMLLAYRLSRHWGIALLVAIMVIAVGRRMYYPRPPVITNLMLTGQLCLLVAVGEGWLRKRWLFLLVPFIALWTNLHGGWMAGGVLFGIFVIGMLLSEFKNRLPALPFSDYREVLSWKFLFPLGFLLVLATLANPYLYHLYALPGRVLSDRHLVQSIGELASPNFYFVIDFELIVLGTLVLAFYTRYRPNFFELMVYLFFLHQAIQHVRHLSLFSLMMVPLTARLLAAALQQSLASLPTPLWQRTCKGTSWALASLLFLWVVINPREGGSLTAPLSTGTYLQRNLSFVQEERGYLPWRFPSALVDYIELADLEGRMYNGNNYAGYLIWRLSPEKHKVFSDSRFDIFGGQIMRLEEQISMGNLNLLDEHDINWAITQSTKVMSMFLEADPRWALAARFPQPLGDWEVWIRDTEENAALLDRARRTAPMAGAVAP